MHSCYVRAKLTETCLIDAITRCVHKLGAAVQVVQPGALLRKLLHRGNPTLAERRQCYTSVMLG